MDISAEPTCRVCGRKMVTVADIAPFGESPGLRAFLCEACGAVDSILTQAAIQPSEMAQTQSQDDGEINVPTPSQIPLERHRALERRWRQLLERTRSPKNRVRGALTHSSDRAAQVRNTYKRDSRRAH